VYVMGSSIHHGYVRGLSLSIRPFFLFLRPSAGPRTASPLLCSRQYEGPLITYSTVAIGARSNKGTIDKSRLATRCGLVSPSTHVQSKSQR
jgi:hypothetical protein